MPISTVSAATAAETSKNSAISVDFTVQERNNVALKGYLFRRGIAFEQGKLYSPDDICLTENGKPIISDAEVLETYEDGSIKWLLVSGTVDLRPGELKRLVVTNGNGPKSDAKVEKTGNGLIVDTKNIDMTIGVGGIESLKIRGRELLTTGNINLYVTYGNKKYNMSSNEFRIIKQTDSYIKVAFGGRISGEVKGEIWLTIPEGASRLQIDHRVTAENHIFFQSVGLDVGMKYNGAPVGTVVNDNYLNLGNVELATYDNTRFNGGTGFIPAEKTGYVINKNNISFAPLLNDVEYKWWDGMSRTAHLYICVDGEGEGWIQTLQKMPSSFADPEQYVKAGEILSTEVPAVVGEFHENMVEAHKRSVGYFEAGMQINYDPITDSVALALNIPGELEYNYGIAVMQTGNEDLYRSMLDISELRSDICVYKGMHNEIHGMMRARVYPISNPGDPFYGSHSYYSDEGGLYMTYLLSGDEYAYDSYKLCINKAFRDIYERSTGGSYHAEYISLRKADPYFEATDYGLCETRGLIRARTMYLASRHFHDPKYAQATFDMLKWAHTYQMEDGDFSQAINHDGTRYYQVTPAGYRKQLPIKNYVNLMGLRGISQLLDYEELQDNEMLREVVFKYADQLCSQGEQFGPVLMNPTGDIDKMEVNEDGGRFTDGRATIMAVDVICTAFEQTGDDYYLEWICKFLEGYVASAVAGKGGQANDKGYGLNVWGSEILRSTSFMRTSDNLAVIFRENKDKIREMGYEHVAIAFSNEAQALGRAAETNTDFPFLTHNVYELDDTRALFAMSWRPDGVMDANVSWEQDIEMKMEGTRLWTNITNVLNNPYNITLAKRMDFIEQVGCFETQISLDDFTGNAEATVNSYTKDKVEFTILGDFEAAISIKDGIFAIDNNKGYKLDITKVKGGIRVTLTEGGDVKPQNNKISFVVDDEVNYLDAVGLKLFNGTKAENKAFDTALNRDELISIVKAATGCDITLKSEFPTWQEFSKELVSAIGAVDSSVLSDAGLYAVFEDVTNPAISDEKAVQVGYDTLDIEYTTERLSSDVYLAKTLANGVKVKWTSSREDILSTDGMLVRNNIDCDSVTLTAEISKGSAVKTKTFVLPLDQTPPSPLISKSAYDQFTNMVELYEQRGVVEFTYDATPLQPKTDCLMVFSADGVPMTENAHPQYRVRFYSNGYIDSYDGGVFKAENKVPWEVGKKYKWRIVIDLNTETFDAFVTPEGGEEVQIAKNYKRRTMSQSIDKINRFWLWSMHNDQVIVENISIYKQPNTPAVDVYTRDAEGNKFGPFQPLDGYVYPTRTKDSRFINWQEIKGTATDKYGQFVNVHLGIERMALENLTLTEVLRESKLVPDTVKDNKTVTKTELTRILGNLRLK